MKLINKNDLIYIAGHTGMAGSAIYRTLERKGYSNLLLTTREELDLLNFEEVQNWFSKNRPQIVILAAAKVGGIYANSTYPASFILENLKIQNNVIETSWKSGVKRFLFLGSSCIYPKKARQPIKEEYLLSGKLEATNEWYAIAKIAGIKLCQALRKQYGFDAINLMPTNLYGPGDNYISQNSHVLPALIKRFHHAKLNSLEYVTCWGSGLPRREFLHVDDLGDACVFALENWDPNSENAPKDKKGQPLELLNVGTGIDITIKELAEFIANETGYKGQIKWDTSKPDGTLKKLLNINSFKSLGWTAKTSLKEGIIDTIKIFKDELKQGTIRL